MGHRVPMETPVMFFAFVVLLFGFDGFSKRNYSGAIVAVCLAAPLTLLCYYLLTHYAYPRPFSYPRHVFNAQWRPLQFMIAFVLGIVSSLSAGAMFLLVTPTMATGFVQTVLFFVFLPAYHVLIGKWGQTASPMSSRTSIRSRGHSGSTYPSRMPFDSSMEGRMINVKYPAPCLRCSKMISKGERALWKKGVGIWHRDCG